MKTYPVINKAQCHEDIGVSGQFHGLVTLLPGKQALLPIRQEAAPARTRTLAVQAASQSLY